MASNFGLGRLDGKVALITGASSGIGAGTAKMFCKLGAKVTITGRNEEKLNKIGDECQQISGAKALRIPGDITNEDVAKRTVDATIQEFGQLDILVNNAGIGAIGSIFSSSVEQYDQVMEVNVRAVYRLTMLCVPYLEKTKGNIVNISSVNGLRSFGNTLAYNMSKGSLDKFTGCCAVDLGPKKIRVNSVNPGVIPTGIHLKAGLSDEVYQKLVDGTEFNTALGRTGTVDEVAKVIAFLASDCASYVTGALVPIDGGIHTMTPNSRH